MSLLKDTHELVQDWLDELADEDPNAFDAQGRFRDPLAHPCQWLKPNGNTPRATAARNLSVRSLKLAGEAGVAVEEWEMVLVAFGNECTYCGAKERLCKDHIVALVGGGSHTLKNIIPACRSCNSSKGKKHLATWLLKRGDAAFAAAMDRLERGQARLKELLSEL